MCMNNEFLLFPLGLGLGGCPFQPGSDYFQFVPVAFCWLHDGFAGVYQNSLY